MAFKGITNHAVARYGILLTSHPVRFNILFPMRHRML
jgi:hypothetical protein